MKAEREPLVVLAITLGLGLLQIPMLASSPQNPDGAELVMAALYGGVLHPSGYPLQAWLDRLFVLIPFMKPALSLSVLSWFFQMGTCFLLMRTALRLGAGWTGALLGTAWFAFFPSTWTLGLQPEKYAVANFLFMAVISNAVDLGKKSRDGTSDRDAIIVGGLFGLALSQHLIGLLVAPAYGAALRSLSGKGATRRFIIALVCTILVPLVFYGSLFLLRRPGGWPDWGLLGSFSDWVRHVTRSEYRVLQGMVDNPLYPPGSGLRIYLSDSLSTFSVMMALPFVGVFTLWNGRRRVEALYLSLVLVLALVFLSFAKIYPNSLIALSYLERYSGVAVVATALLAGSGTGYLTRLAPLRLRLLPPVTIGALIIILFFSGRERADVSRDHVLDSFREGLSVLLRPDDYYFSGTDLEIFHGVPWGKAHRFPIFGDYSWALSSANRLLEPRLSQTSTPTSVGDLAKSIYESGATSVASKMDPFMSLGIPLLQRGYLWVAKKGVKERVDGDTAQAAAKLCPVIQGIQDTVPSEGHFYSRYLWQWFSFAYDGAETYFKSQNDSKGADIAHRISEALQENRTPSRWHEGCADLVKHLETRAGQN